MHRFVDAAGVSRAYVRVSAHAYASVTRESACIFFSRARGTRAGAGMHGAAMRGGAEIWMKRFDMAGAAQTNASGAAIASHAVGAA